MFSTSHTKNKWLLILYLGTNFNENVAHALQRIKEQHSITPCATMMANSFVRKLILEANHQKRWFSSHTKVQRHRLSSWPFRIQQTTSWSARWGKFTNFNNTSSSELGIAHTSLFRILKEGLLLLPHKVPVVDDLQLDLQWQIEYAIRLERYARPILSSPYRVEGSSFPFRQTRFLANFGRRQHTTRCTQDTFDSFDDFSKRKMELT